MLKIAATLLFTSLSVGGIYVVYLVCFLTERLFMLCGHPEAMSDPTRFITQNWWMFSIAVAVIGVGSVQRGHRRPLGLLQSLSAGACLQGVVIWGVAFCSCYTWLKDEMHPYRDSQFDFEMFFTFCGGLFPVTLLALLLAAATVAVWCRNSRPARKEA